MRIRAYRALRPVPELAGKIGSLPYDVVSTSEARALAEGNPLSMLRVVRAELEMPDDTDPYSDAVYSRAKANFNKLVDAGHLERESTPCLYVYEQRMGEHRQTGFAALCHVDDYDSGLIKRHEKTRQIKEDDRTRLTSVLGANPGPVFLTYRGQAVIDAEAEKAKAAAPLFDFVAPDGIQHTVWRHEDAHAVIKAFGPVPCVYVADGHHRAASAARVARERAAANPNHTGEEDYNWFLTVLFPGTQLKILPYNRVVVDLNGRSPSEILEALRGIGKVSSGVSPVPEVAGDVRMFLNGSWHGLTLTPPAGADPASKLDVSLLQDQVLAPLLGIDDPRTSNRIDFVGGIRGTEYLENEVRAARGAIAFSLHPVSVEQLMDIADAGQIMPPKSTWFEPKLRSGLFMHVF